MKHFNLHHNERPEIEGLRAAFRYTASTAPFTDKVSAIRTDIPIAAKRLNFIRAHEKSFFQNHSTYDRIPMVAAALMGSYVEEMESRSNEFVYSNLSRIFAQQTPVKMKRIGENACMLAEVGLSFYKNSREVVFCAHLLALESTDAIKGNFNFFGKEFYMNYLEHTFPAWKSFADRKTELGQYLQREIAGLSHRICKKYQPTEIIAFPAVKG